MIEKLQSRAEKFNSFANALAINSIKTPRSANLAKKMNIKFLAHLSSIFWNSGVFYSVDGQGFCKSQLEIFNVDGNFQYWSKISIPVFLFAGPSWCTENVSSSLVGSLAKGFLRKSSAEHLWRKNFLLRQERVRKFCEKFTEILWKFAEKFQQWPFLERPHKWIAEKGPIENFHPWSTAWNFQPRRPLSIVSIPRPSGFSGLVPSQQAKQTKQWPICEPVCKNSPSGTF